MTSETNSEIDCDGGVLEDAGSFTIVKPRKNERRPDWTVEAIAIADAMAPLSPEEQKFMLDRMAEALGVRDGRYIGVEKPIPQFADCKKKE